MRKSQSSTLMDAFVRVDGKHWSGSAVALTGPQGSACEWEGGDREARQREDGWTNQRKSSIRRCCVADESPDLDAGCDVVEADVRAVAEVQG